MKSRSSHAVRVACVMALALWISANGWSAENHSGNIPDEVSGNGKDFTAIQHFVFIIKENHSFDNYFGQFPGANGTNTGVISDGQTIPLEPLPDEVAYFTDHSEGAAITAFDNGKMDDYDLFPGGNQNGDFMAYRQLSASDIPNYWYYAQNFVLGDGMFSSLHGDSFPNHLYAIAATSGGVLDTPVNLVKPKGDYIPNWGCDSGTPFIFARALNKQGIAFASFPCYDFKTLADSLDDATPAISWTSYAPSEGQPGYNFSTYDSINHIRNSPLWAEHVVPDSQFVEDAIQGKLPAVSWLVTNTGSEHPPNSTCDGENWTVQQVNAVMQGADWDSTAIFIVWDDFGGFYDHAYPDQLDIFGLGPRVPFLIISPYAIPGYVSHTQYEFSSVLKTIEERFNLPFLTDRDKNANDLWDSFNFNQAPNPPQVLQPRNCPLNSAYYMQFGSQAIGTTGAARNMPFTNWRTSDVTISNVSITGDFTQKSNCSAKIRSGYQCSFDISFTPTVSGVETGALTITDNDSSSPQVISLTGIGSSVSVAPPYPGVNFDTVTFGSNKSQSATLTNVSSSPVTISSTAIVGINAADFSSSGGCQTVQPEKNCKWTVTFTPTPQILETAGQEHANFVIYDDAPGSPHSTLLYGTGSALNISPQTLNFGNQQEGTSSAPQTITITNKWAQSITLSSIVTAGDYTRTSNCTATLAPGAKCTISVTFKPTLIGLDKGLVNIATSDITSPAQLIMVGTGVSGGSGARTK